MLSTDNSKHRKQPNLFQRFQSCFLARKPHWHLYKVCNLLAPILDTNMARIQDVPTDTLPQIFNELYGPGKRTISRSSGGC